MENITSQMVFRLTPESLSDEIRICTTLPQYHVLICVDSTQSKTDLARSLEFLVPGAQTLPDIFSDDTHVHFRNGSKISLCTHLDMDVYADQDIHSVLIYDRVPYADAVAEYAKAIIKPYSIPNDYEPSRETYVNRFNSILRRARRGIDTSAMDNFLEEI